jgi:hypothetical protein
MKPAYLASIPVFFLLACGGRSALDELEVVNPGSGTISGDSGGGSVNTGAAGSSSSSASSQGGPSGETTGGQPANGGTADWGAATGENDSGPTTDDSGSTGAGRPPVSCGGTACESAQECCLEVDLMGTTSTCIDQGGACPTGITLSCTDRTDCANGDVCCVGIAERAATCQAECTLAGGINGAGVELCSTTVAGAGCRAGELCIDVPTTSLAVCIPVLGGAPTAAAAGFGTGTAVGVGAGAGGGVGGAGAGTGAGGGPTGG